MAICIATDETEQQQIDAASSAIAKKGFTVEKTRSNNWYNSAIMQEVIKKASSHEKSFAWVPDFFANFLVLIVIDTHDEDRRFPESPQCRLAWPCAPTSFECIIPDAGQTAEKTNDSDLNQSRPLTCAWVRDRGVEPENFPAKIRLACKNTTKMSRTFTFGPETAHLWCYPMWVQCAYLPISLPTAHTADCLISIIFCGNWLLELDASTVPLQI